jgi:hypothetical protein
MRSKALWTGLAGRRLGAVPLWIVAGVLLLLGVAAPASAAGSHQVPIKGTMSFAADPSGGTIACTSPVGLTHPRVVDFHGIISHLGNTSSVSTISDCSLSLTTGLFVEHGQYVHTAANGDQAYGTSEIVVNVVTGAMTFTAEATGGTGRFAGVSGEVSGTGTADLATGTGTLTFSGWMSNIGSTK